MWECLKPVSSDGILKFKRDNWPICNSLFRKDKAVVANARVAKAVKTAEVANAPATIAMIACHIMAGGKSEGP